MSRITFRGILPLLGIACTAAGCGGSDGPVTLPTIEFVVTNLNDAGPGSLRGVIAAAGPSSATASVLVRFAPVLAGGTVTLLSEIGLSYDVTIDGNGPTAAASERINLSGGDTNRIFTNNGRTVALRNLVLRDGFSAANGGAIRNFGSLLLERVFVSACEAAQGGALLLEYASDVAVLRSAFTDCHGTDGGAISGVGSRLLVRDTSFTFNSASDDGGGALYLLGCDTTIVNSTLHGNTATDAVNGQAAAILAQPSVIGGLPSTLRLLHCTITGNSSAAGTGPAVNVLPVPSELTTLQIQGTIIAENTGPTNCDFDYHSGTGTQSVTISDSILGVGNGSTIGWDGVNDNLVGTLIAPIDPDLTILTPLFGPGDGRLHRFTTDTSPARNRVELGDVALGGLVVDRDQNGNARGGEGFTDAGSTDAGEIP